MTAADLTAAAGQLPADQQQLPLALWHAGQLVAVQGLTYQDRYSHGNNPPCLLVSPFAPPAEAPAPAPAVAKDAKK